MIVWSGMIVGSGCDVWGIIKPQGHHLGASSCTRIAYGGRYGVRKLEGGGIASNSSSLSLLPPSRYYACVYKQFAPIC